jgi:importin-5
LKHSHHYVRFAACQAIGQIATDHQPYFQNTYAAEVLPALIATVDDQSLKVQSHAISALINFNEEVNKSDLLPYADALMQMLFERIGPDKSRKVSLI